MSVPILGSILDFINSGRAAKAVSNANIAAEHGVLGAVDEGKANLNGSLATGQAGVNSALAGGTDTVNSALGNASSLLDTAKGTAIDSVHSSTTDANKQLQDLLTQISGGLSSYKTAGETGVKGLTDLANAPKFNFSYDDYQKDPSMQFVLDTIKRQTENSASARGLGSSGAVMQELQDRAGKVGSTYYQDAFNRAKDTYGLNAKTGLDLYSALTNTGLKAGDQELDASKAFGSQMANNTLADGKFAAGTDLTTAELLSKMGIDVGQSTAARGDRAAEFNATSGNNVQTFLASLGLQGSKLAGDYAVNAGNAHGAGILGQGQAINSGIEAVASLFGGMPMGSVPLGGGNATSGSSIFAGLFGGGK